MAKLLGPPSRTIRHEFNSSSLVRQRQGICIAGRAFAAASERYTGLVFAHKLRVEIIVGAERRACPLDWLDNFCMRDFTGQAEFDDTLPLADGLLEAGSSVKPERLAEAMAAWFSRRGKGQGRPVQVEIRPA